MHTGIYAPLTITGVAILVAALSVAVYLLVAYLTAGRPPPPASSPQVPAPSASACELYALGANCTADNRCEWADGRCSKKSVVPPSCDSITVAANCAGECKWNSAGGVCEKASVPADPTKPDTDPTKPDTDPTKPDTDPTKPVAVPIVLQGWQIALIAVGVFVGVFVVLVFGIRKYRSIRSRESVSPVDSDALPSDSESAKGPFPSKGFLAKFDKFEDPSLFVDAFTGMKANDVIDLVEKGAAPDDPLGMKSLAAITSWVGSKFGQDFYDNNYMTRAVENKLLEVSLHHDLGRTSGAHEDKQIAKDAFNYLFRISFGNTDLDATKGIYADFLKTDNGKKFEKIVAGGAKAKEKLKELTGIIKSHEPFRPYQKEYEERVQVTDLARHFVENVFVRHYGQKRYEHPNGETGVRRLFDKFIKSTYGQGVLPAILKEGEDDDKKLQNLNKTLDDYYVFKSTHNYVIP